MSDNKSIELARKAVQEGFDKCIGVGKRAYVHKKRLPAAEAIGLIHGAAGLAFVAHPGINHTATKILPRLLELPFDGIEDYHTKHTPGQV